MSSAVQPCIQRELVIVVGAEDHYSGSQIAGNRLMFMGQAVRYVRGWAKGFDLTTVFVYRGETHTAAQIAALKASVTTYGGTTEEVEGWGAVASHINKTSYNGCTKKVQVLLFLAHGTPKEIWLSHKQGILFTTSEVSMVNASSFVSAEDERLRYRWRHVTSWACQTGNDGVSTTQDDALKNSLAQQMADVWNIRVFASVTQTNYTNTWASGLAGRLKFGRRLIDGAVWQDEGADGSVYSSTGARQGAGKMNPGMYELGPGQTSGYKAKSLY